MILNELPNTLDLDSLICVGYQDMQSTLHYHIHFIYLDLGINRFIDLIIEMKDGRKVKTI
jgi:hypothetical protein